MTSANNSQAHTEYEPHRRSRHQDRNVTTHAACAQTPVTGYALMRWHHRRTDCFGSDKFKRDGRTGLIHRAGSRTSHLYGAGVMTSSRHGDRRGLAVALNRDTSVCVAAWLGGSHQPPGPTPLIRIALRDFGISSLR